MASDRSTLISDELVKHIFTTAQSLRESANKLTCLARSRGPDRLQAKWLIKMAYFKLQFLGKHFDMDF